MQRNRKKKTSKQSAQRKKAPLRDMPRTVVSRSPYLMPERYSARLTFATTFVLNNAGFKDAAYVLRPTSIYDVDPAIGGASAFGLAEFSNFYGRYKVHSSTLSLHASNLDSEGATLFLTPSTENPGNNPSDIGPWFAATATRMKPMGSYTANSAVSLRHSYATQTLSGVDFFAEDAYASAVNTNPTANTYWIVGAVRAGPSNFIYGVSVVLKMVITVHFYQRKPLVSPAASIHRPQLESDPYPPPIPVYMVPAPAAPVVVKTKGSSLDQSPPDPERARGTGPSGPVNKPNSSTKGGKQLLSPPPEEPEKQ